jgi:hypothetical protein
MPGKRVQFDDETWSQLDVLAKTSMNSFQELADEAFRDLLKKHGYPASLREALRKSAGIKAAVVPFRRKKRL